MAGLFCHNLLKQTQTLISKVNLDSCLWRKYSSRGQRDSDLVSVLICKALFLHWKVEHVRAHCKPRCPGRTSPVSTQLSSLTLSWSLMNSWTALRDSLSGTAHCADDTGQCRFCVLGLFLFCILRLWPNYLQRNNKALRVWVRVSCDAATDHYKQRVCVFKEEHIKYQCISSRLACCLQVFNTLQHSVQHCARELGTNIF